MSISEAARRLGLTPQAVRNRVRAGRLEGIKEGRVWRVRASDVDKAAESGAGPTKAEPSSDLHAIRAVVNRLAERDSSAERLLAAIEGERDRFRAEASAAKEAALRVNAAAVEIDKAVRGLLQVLELQADALAQLLAPGSPADLISG